MVLGAISYGTVLSKSSEHAGVVLELVSKMKTSLKFKRIFVHIVSFFVMLLLRATVSVLLSTAKTTCTCGAEPSMRDSSLATTLHVSF